MKTKRYLLASLMIVTLISFTLSGCTAKTSGDVSYGKVTEVSGSALTIAMGTLNEGNTNSTGTNQDQTSTITNSSSTQPTPPTDSGSGTPPTPPTDGETGTETPASGDSSSAPPELPTGSAPAEMPEMLTLTGTTKTITLDDTITLTKQSSVQPGTTSSSSDSTESTAATAADIAVGTVLKITYQTNSDTIQAIEIVAGGGQPGGSGGTVETGTGATNLTDGETLNGGTYVSTTVDENAIRADNAITAAITDVTVNKTDGAASSSDASSFYGLNSAVLALSNAVLNITGGSVTATAEGANGVFSYDGATVNIKDTLINVTGGNAGGIEVAGGGIMNARNLIVNANSKAAIRSDRGGGTMIVDGGTYTTSGSTGAPAVYSTANITVNNATLTANTSEAVVVEGLNSVALNNCIVSGNMTGSNGSSADNIHNVMLYQSMSGDADVGNSSFTMAGGSLTSNSGDMFYITNTDASVTLSGVTLVPAVNTKLLLVSGNDGTRGWGTAGSNGGNCSFTAANQKLDGDIQVDAISTLDLTIKEGSSFTGSINSDGTAASSLKLSLDDTSTWSLTANSYVTEFNGSRSNVELNGHTLYVNGVANN
jgi:hypothetical protein